MHNKPAVYLDYNATAPLRPEIRIAMDEVASEPLNPSSIHASGRKARKLVEDARRKILHYVNSENLIFCASGTESNNLALAQNNFAIISALEHDSIYKTKNKTEIKVLESGIIDLKHLEEILKSTKSPALISVMLANNETGIIQPVRDAAVIAHKYGALIHSDAVQAFGKIDIDFKELGVDMMTISCHKIGGPLGAAALVHKAGIEIKALMFGGGQEKNKRPGTENVAAIIGFGKSIETVSRETSENRNYLEKKIKSISSAAIIFGEKIERLPNTTCVAMPGVESPVQLIHFDTNNICISTGSACSSGKVEVSRVLKAMNTPLAKNAIRISTGWKTTKQEIDQFIEEWQKLYQHTRIKAA